MLHSPEHWLPLELVLGVLDLGHLGEAQSQERLLGDIAGGLGLGRLEAQSPGQHQRAREDVRAEAQAPGGGGCRHDLNTFVNPIISFNVTLNLYIECNFDVVFVEPFFTPDL